MSRYECHAKRLFPGSIYSVNDVWSLAIVCRFFGSLYRGSLSCSPVARWRRWWQWWRRQWWPWWWWWWWRWWWWWWWLRGGKWCRWERDACTRLLVPESEWNTPVRYTEYTITWRTAPWPRHAVQLYRSLAHRDISVAAVSSASFIVFVFVGERQPPPCWDSRGGSNSTTFTDHVRVHGGFQAVSTQPWP